MGTLLMSKETPFKVKIVWGSTESNYTEKQPCTYSFKTEEELTAFLDGVEEACGWMDYEVVDED